VKEYELYVPLTLNDGSPVNPAILVHLRERLLERFGGLTFFPQPNEGFWTFGGVTYRDEIVIYRVLTQQTRATRKFFRELKEELSGLTRKCWPRRIFNCPPIRIIASVNYWPGNANPRFPMPSGPTCPGSCTCIRKDF